MFHCFINEPVVASESKNFQCRHDPRQIFGVYVILACLSTFETCSILFLTLDGWRRCVQIPDIQPAHQVIPHHVRSLCPCSKFELLCSLLFLISKPSKTWRPICVAERIVRSKYSVLISRFPRNRKPSDSPEIWIPWPYSVCPSETIDNILFDFLFRMDSLGPS